MKVHFQQQKGNTNLLLQLLGVLNLLLAVLLLKGAIEARDNVAVDMVRPQPNVCADLRMGRKQRLSHAEIFQIL